MALFVLPLSQPGGDPLDIKDHHAVGKDEPLQSVWLVVDAIHEVSPLKIQFPKCRQEQLCVAQGFEPKSAAGINNYSRAIDGILV